MRARGLVCSDWGSECDLAFRRVAFRPVGMHSTFTFLSIICPALGKTLGFILEKICSNSIY